MLLLLLLAAAPQARAGEVLGIYLHEGGTMDERKPTRSVDATVVFTREDPHERFQMPPLATNATFALPPTLNLTFQASMGLNAQLRAVLDVDGAIVAESYVNVTMSTPGVSVTTAPQDVNVSFPFPAFPLALDPGRRIGLGITLLIPEGEQIVITVTAPISLVLVFDSAAHPGGFVVPPPPPPLPPPPPQPDPCGAPDACHHHHDHCAQAGPAEENATGTANVTNQGAGACPPHDHVVPVPPDVPDTCETTMLCVASVGVGPAAVDVRVVPFFLGLLGGTVVLVLLLARRANHAPDAHVLPDSRVGRATVASGAGISFASVVWALQPTLQSEAAVSAGMGSAGVTAMAALYVILGGPVPPALARHPLLVALRGFPPPPGGAPAPAPATAPPPPSPPAAAIAAAPVSYRRVPVLVAKEPVPTDDDLAAALARWNVRRGAP